MVIIRTETEIKKGPSFVEEAGPVEHTASKLAKSLKKTTIVGSKFPELTARSLAGNIVTLPDACEGKICLIGIAFERRAQDMLDSWFEPFEREFGDSPVFSVYEVPMVGPHWNFFSLIIDSGMRGGIPAEKHNYVLTLYEDYSKYQELLDMEDRDLAYIFLLDKKGIISWKGKGSAESGNLRELIEAASLLL
ncbi:MAG: hypothetical protein PHW56_13005 [Methanosarcinaceae archaeon]|nr:hypothetical protein [Methanosarcinaceae archaeon]